MPKHKPAPWLKAMKAAPSRKVGVTWYTETEWSAVKAAAVDAERFEDTYEAWLAMAEASRSQLLAVGVITEPVYIEASQLLAWCLAHGKTNNAASRSAFVAHLLHKQSGGAA